MTKDDIQLIDNIICYAHKHFNSRTFSSRFWLFIRSYLSGAIAELEKMIEDVKSEEANLQGPIIRMVVVHGETMPCVDGSSMELREEYFEALVLSRALKKLLKGLPTYAEDIPF
jgi:hypothetical protein